MKATNARMSQQLSVVIEGGQLKISIGIALLAFAVQQQNSWPKKFAVTDLREFAQSIARQLQREEEDGTTPVHRMLDAAAEEVIERGGDGVDEGNVRDGVALAKFVLDTEKSVLKSIENPSPNANLRAEPVAWRVRVKSDDPEEWSLLPAGGGADFLNRDGYDCQPLYTSAAPEASDAV